MSGKVISVFAGLGKTTVGNKYKNVLDLRSSAYRCDYSNIKESDYEKMKCSTKRIPNPDWPTNYLQAIKEAQEKYDLVLVPSNLDIRELLTENKIDFIFVLPEKTKEVRAELIKRYENRGNSNELITQVISYFDTWSRNQSDYDYPIEILKKGQYLEDLLIELNLL